MSPAKYEPTHGDRVRRGSKRGVVLRIASKRKPGTHYFRVRWNDGTFDWPDQVRADSDGAYLGTCGECGIEFFSDAVNARRCPNCVRRETADDERMTADYQSRASGIRDPRRYRFGIPRRRERS